MRLCLLALALPFAMGIGQVLDQPKHFSMTGPQGWGVQIVSRTMAREGTVLHLRGAVEIKTWSRPNNVHEGFMILRADEADFHIDTGAIEPRGNVRLEPHDR